MAKYWLFLIFNFSVVTASFAYDSIQPYTQKIDSGWEFCPKESFNLSDSSPQSKCYSIKLPNQWETILPNYDGFGVLKTTFVISKLSKNQMAFYTKNIRDADKVYINGKLIGQTGEFPPYYQKAVFYSRLYPIPIGLLNEGSANTLTVWIYNGGRPGGIVYDSPIITPYKSQVEKLHKKQFIDAVFIVVLFVFSLFSLITFAFNRSAKENLFYGLFLLTWSIYLLTSSDLVLLYKLPLNAMFRLNVVLFYTTFVTFIVFIYCFFKEAIPKVVQVINAVVLLCIPISLALPIPEQVYPMVSLVEILVLPAVFYVAWLLIQTNKAHIKYAKLMSIVLGMYVFFGSIEVYLDLFSSNEASKFSPFGPWILLLLSLSLTFIVGHKNMSYYQKATFDGLTGVLRFENFSNRLTKLIAMSIREKKSIVLMMIDLDDFKDINDKYGHIQGDKVLMMVSKAMESELRSFDLISRYGGDEFCVAAMMNTTEDIKHFVQRFHHKVNSLEIEGYSHPIKISTTIGVAISHPNAKIPGDELVKIADDLLIEAKLSAKGEIKW